jgi:DNA-binding MarR family transcriptional regulator
LTIHCQLFTFRYQIGKSCTSTIFAQETWFLRANDMEQSSAETGSDMLSLSLSCRKADKLVAQTVGLSVDEVHFINLLSTGERSWSVKQLRLLLGLSPTRTSKILRSLERQGFVTRALSELDRRMEQVALTMKGNAMAEELVDISIEVGRKVFDIHPPAAMRLKTPPFLEASD